MTKLHLHSQVKFSMAVNLAIQFLHVGKWKAITYIEMQHNIY